MIEGSLDVKTSDNMEKWKSRGGKSQGGEVKKWEDQIRERVRSKKMQVPDKVGKSRVTMFFQLIWDSGGSKNNLGKAAGAGASWPDERWKIARRCGAKHVFKSKCTKHTYAGPLLEVEMSKDARRCGAKHMSKSKCTKQTILGPLLEVEMSKKWQSVVARSTFPSQNVQNKPESDHFWKLRCRKSASRCGTKHISKSKCTKQTRFGPLLEVQMSKSAPVWREAHVQVKSGSNWGHTD